MTTGVSLPASSASGVRRSRSLPLARAATFLLLVFAFFIGLAAFRAVPDVMPATAPPEAFSAARAMEHLTVIAAAPRPAGSAESTAVRDYLVAQIRALGLEPQTQSVLVPRHSPGYPETHLIRVENVMTRVPGTVPGGPALLVSGHYDTVPTSPGASDCGMCTVVTLETLRAVMAGPRPRNDIIFLFTDGEELAVAGAEGFMSQHPWATDIGLSLVFEGLGNDSAPLLYISGEESGAVVGEALDTLAAEIRYPLASSFLHEFMWAVAGNTGSDLDAFLNGAPGVGLLYLSLPTIAAYHATADNVAALDARSVQSMGDFALALTRHFGDAALDELPRAPTRVAFPLWPGLTAHYSGAWALPLAALATVLLIVALVAGWRRRALSLKGVAAGIVAWLLTALTALIAVTFAWWLARLLTPSLHNMNSGGWYGGGVYLAAALTLTLAVGLGWRRLWRRRVAADDLTAGALVWWALLAWLTAAALPGMSYLFVWPLLVAAGGWLPAFWRPERAGLGAAVMAVAAALALWLFAPVFYWLWIYVGRAETFMGVPLAALPVIFAAPVVGLVAPVVEWLVGDTRYEIRDTSSGRRSFLVSRISYLLLLLAVALFVAPALLLRPSAERPWSNAVVYTLDADTGEAHWVTLNDSRNGRGTRYVLDEWTTQFLPDAVEATTIDPWLVLESDTPYAALRAPTSAVALPRTTVSGAGDGQRVTLEVVRPPTAWVTELRLHSEAPITAIRANGQPLDLGGTAPTDYLFKVIGGEGRLSLELTTAGLVTARTLDRLLVDLPALAEATGLAVAPRPAWMMPASGSDVTDGALVSGEFTIR